MSALLGEWATPQGYQFWHTLRFLRMGQRDPTVHRSASCVRIARWFPTGPAVVELRWEAPKIIGAAWGPGAEEAIGAIPRWAGLHDTPCTDFGNEGLNRRLSSVMGVHLSRAPFVSHELLSHILQQKIAWRDAARLWFQLVSGVGEVAPGPFRLRMPLSFQQMRRTPHGFFQEVGLTEPRIRAIREIGRLGYRIDKWLCCSTQEFTRRVTTLPSIGPWTAQHVLAVSMGEPDIVVRGDYTIPHTVAWVLAGEMRGTDARMDALLRPFTGNRWRLVRLFWALNLQAPRRGPRMSGQRRRYGYAGPSR